MLSHIKIDRFKSLSSLEIELGRINMFIGANGSGKSNLLEGLGVLGSAAFGRVDDETLLRRGVRPGVPRLYKSAFPTTKKETVQNIVFQATAASGAFYRAALWNPIEKPSPAWGFMTEKLARGESDVVETRTTTSAGTHNREQGMAALRTATLRPGDPALVLMDELRGYSIFCPNTPSLRGLTQDLQSREPVGLSGGRLPEAVEELLSESKKSPILGSLVDQVSELIDWAKSFSASPSVGVPLSPSAARSRLVIQFEDKFMAKARNKLTGYDASEGALYVLFCAVLALHPRAPKCLAVDNVDQALNPLLAKKLMRAICDWTTQIGGGQQWLMTAHNPAVLDGLPLRDDSVRLFAVDRSSTGQTKVQRIDIATALKVRPDESWTLSRMWMNGLLGAVPNV